jgi:uncharacterized protein YeaO (DUF488 family)
MLIHERPLTVLTSRIGCPDEDAIDIRTGPFAPSDSLRAGLSAVASLLVRGSQVTDESQAIYKARYVSQMRASYVQQRPAWDALLARSRAVLCCACTDSAQCHRQALAQILVKCGAVYLGEWQPGTPWLDLGPAEGGAA